MRVSISRSACSVVATGVFTEMAFEPTAAVIGALVAVRPPGGFERGSPTPTPVWPPSWLTTATNQEPGEGTSIWAEYTPAIGLSGERSWHFGYAVNGNHRATNGPTAWACSSFASHTVGFPSVTSPFWAV